MVYLRHVSNIYIGIITVYVKLLTTPHLPLSTTYVLSHPTDLSSSLNTTFTMYFSSRVFHTLVETLNKFDISNSLANTHIHFHLLPDYFTIWLSIYFHELEEHTGSWAYACVRNVAYVSLQWCKTCETIRTAWHGTFAVILPLCEGNLLHWCISFPNGQLYGPFVFSLLIADKHSSCWWFKTAWCTCVAVVMNRVAYTNIYGTQQSVNYFDTFVHADCATNWRDVHFV